MLALGLGSALLCAEQVTAAEPRASSALAQNDAGRPKVVLDRLDFPASMGASLYEKYLRRRLKSEARQLDWGAGRGSTIEYRFAIEKLQIVEKGRVVEVRCSATGSLPRGKKARSQLSFGGESHRRSKVVHQVLDIVARGVLTRLAQLERVRRGQQSN